MIMRGLNQTVCDECLETFYFTHKDIKEEYLGAMLTEVYFKCPHCGRKYVILIEDKQSRDYARQGRLSDRIAYQKMKGWI